MDPRIGILTVSHCRPDTDKAFCLMMDRLRRDFPDIFVRFVCVVSREEDKDVFEDHNFEVYIYPNDPLGAKHNHGLMKMKGEVTHVLYIGSDDIVDNRYVSELIKYADKDIVWGRGLTFYSVKFNRGRFWGQPFRRHPSPARLISSRVLDKVDWKIWDDNINRLLDANCWDNLVAHVTSQHVFEVRKVGGLLMDIKGSVSMNPYQVFANNGVAANMDWSFDRLSKEEVEYIKQLHNGIHSITRK